MVCKNISKERLKNVVEDGKKIVSISGAQVILLDKELKKIEQEEKTQLQGFINQLEL